MKKSNAFNLLIFILSLGICDAQTPDFNYKLELLNVKEQWHKIILPDHFFEHAKFDFSDVRIYGFANSGDTLEIPYLPEDPDFKTVTKELKFELINQSSIQSNHFFTFDMYADQTINEIQLDFEQDNYDWKIQLEGSNDQKEWFLITSNYRILSIRNEVTDYHFSKVIFPDSKFRYYRCMIKSSIKPLLKHASVFERNKTNVFLKNVPIKDIHFSSDKKIKRTDVVIELPYQMPVSEISIRVKDTIDFYRPLKLLYFTDSVQIQNGWKLNFSELTSGTLNSIDKKPFNFNTIVTKKIKLLIENYDNPPLTIDSINLRSPVYSLVARFENTDIPYHLYYGNNKISPPNYDLAYFKIPSDISTIQTGKEQNISKESENSTGSLFQNKLWLWSIMIIIMVTLGWFSFVMIKKNNTP